MGYGSLAMEALTVLRRASALGAASHPDSPSGRCLGGGDLCSPAAGTLASVVRGCGQPSAPVDVK